MMTLTVLEQAVLMKLLEGDHPLLGQLRKQLSICRVTCRAQTGAGFYTHLDVGDAPAADNVKARFGDVLAEIEGMAHGAGFVLYIEGGRLRMLEGYGYDDPWPISVTAYTLRYNSGDHRDWDTLIKKLE